MLTTDGSCLSCICCLPCILFLFVLSVGVPSFLMFVGITRLDECPVQPKIPIWMICVASLLFLQIILESVRPIRDRSMRSFDFSIDCCSSLSLILYLSRIAVLISTIFGIVLVFLSVPLQNRCDSLLYWTAGVYCIVSAIGYSIITAFWICCCCCVFRGAYESVSTED